MVVFRTAIFGILSNPYFATAAFSGSISRNVKCVTQSGQEFNLFKFMEREIMKRLSAIICSVLLLAFFTGGAFAQTEKVDTTCDPGTAGTESGSGSSTTTTTTTTTSTGPA